MTNKYRVAVLLGGKSAEREISLKTGSQVASALKSKGHQVKKIDFAMVPIQELLDFKPDVVFIALHGRLGEDGTVQGLLEVLEIPYVGSGVLASAIGINKIVSKKIFMANGILTPKFEVLTYDEYEKDPSMSQNKIIDILGLPCVVKPACEGSTIGMSIPSKEEDLKRSFEEAFKFDQDLLIEEFINGIEITVGILGNKNPIALPTLEIVSENKVYDYEAKYTAGLSKHIIPARLPKDSRQKAKEVAKKAHLAIYCWGFSRVDLIVDKQGEPYVLEINTIPGMTELSLFPDAARVAGFEFPELVDKLVNLALEED